MDDETYTLGTGLPSASSRDDERERKCVADGGYFVPSELGGRGVLVCENCGASEDDAEEYRPARGDYREDGGRYAVTFVMRDGNPWTAARATTLVAGLRALDGLRVREAHNVLHGFLVAFLVDLDDPERGCLMDDSYEPGRDVGPDPLEV